MKKIITFLMAMGLIFSLSACGEPSGQHQDMVSTLDTVSELQQRQPTPTDLDFSLERYNLIRRAYWVNRLRPWFARWKSPLDILCCSLRAAALWAGL